MTINRFDRVVAVVAFMGVLLFSIVLAYETSTHHSVDMSDDTFVVMLHNDTRETLLAKRCDVSCDSFHDRAELPPGGNLEVSTSGGNIANWWLLSEKTGQAVGCLPFAYQHPLNGVVVNASSYISCPKSHSVSGTDIIGAIIGFAILLFVLMIGIASMAIATIGSNRWARGRGLNDTRVSAITALAALGVLLGGWVIFDFYIVLKETGLFFRRRIKTGQKKRESGNSIE